MLRLSWTEAGVLLSKVSARRLTARVCLIEKELGKWVTRVELCGEKGVVSGERRGPGAWGLGPRRGSWQPKGRLQRRRNESNMDLQFSAR